MVSSFRSSPRTAGRMALTPPSGRDYAELLDVEARYEGLFRNSPDALFWIEVRADGTFAVESVNPAQERVLGQATVGRLGRSLAEWLPPDVAAAVASNYQRCLEAGAPITYEESADLGAGLFHFQTTLVPIRAEDGQFHRIVGMSRDITEKVRGQQAALDQELLFRRLFEHSGDPGLLIIGNRFVDCNQATVDILRARDKAQVLGTHPSELSPPEQPDGRPSKEKADDMIAQAFREGFHRFEWTHRRLDGSLFPVEVLLTVVPYQGQQILHTTWRDHTEALQAEAERRKLEGRILQAQKMESLGVLAGGIAHDFNNLLTAMLGNLSLAQACLPEGHAAHGFLATAEQAVGRASDLTRQMLAYSGRGRFVVQAQDLNEVVRDMAHLLRVSVSKMADLDVRLTEDLPQVEADRAQLQQVVMNLVTNASEALGDAPGRITLRTFPTALSATDLAREMPGQDVAPGHFVALQVEDTGQGMGPDIRARIFEPFFTTKTTGRGLGLSAMLGILRGHQAGLTLVSEPGHGTAFTLYFPAGKPSPPRGPEPERAPTHKALSGRVLVVDDEAEIRSALQRGLIALGLAVDTARDGAEAVALVEAGPGTFDLVLMDLTMPRMDGREAFRRLRSFRADLPVVLMSGYSSEEALQPLQAQGLAGFLPKPFSLRTLESALRPLLQR